ncbi:hypothetical protein A1O3_07316 [Capronia epimyces CBS 606.96]|uniref:Protein HRI1 n=1 Tax=Capronia epimyces CBS 606.96 TaxID=1182542 RepID=W9XLE8_9EURO|nr:uncharacterized protein A1O3_07316 [Capronia epimyces CBS 606.96]EXJ81028.1 hypothetical protein A1O3_07316 [Capronia epimyces CBS 606.96]
MEFYGMTGEKLGTIGQVEEKGAKGADLPRWKKAFLEKPSISIRKGIAWGFSPPYEDTSTLVLTSPNAVFVDIRFPLQPDSSRPLTGNPAFWAFSGTSRTTFSPDTSEVSMPYSAHAVWAHEIDSKGSGISDEGDMFLLPNDDCIEVGMMQNPQTKQVELYKEYWSTPPAEPGSGDLRRSPCVVARTLELGVHRAARNGSGVVIRVGDYCQGIVQQCEHDGSPRGVLVERWQKLPVQRNPALSESQSRDAGDSHQPTEWLMDWRSNTPEGEASIPSLWTCMDDRKLGDQIVIHGVTWSVVEVG